jgi:hypothetical protein
VVHTVLRQVLLGADPIDVEALWERMYRHTLAYGQKGLTMMAISGVDLALWDLRGKREEKSLAEVLGGQAGVTVPMYKTGWSPQEVAEGKLEGYRALKLQVGRLTMEAAVDQLALVRDTMGSEIELMSDAFMQWDLETALGVVKRVEQYNVGWLLDYTIHDVWSQKERIVWSFTCFVISQCVILLTYAAILCNVRHCVQLYTTEQCGTVWRNYGRFCIFLKISYALSYKNGHVDT